MINENTEAIRAKINCDKVPRRTSALVSEGNVLPLRIRKEKIFTIRHKLIEGEYDLDERLNSALDKLIENLLT
jgi:hypothetical protein